jgi:hypothetical protein
VSSIPLLFWALIIAAVVVLMQVSVRVGGSSAPFGVPAADRVRVRVLLYQLSHASGPEIAARDRSQFPRLARRATPAARLYRVLLGVS